MLRFALILALSLAASTIPAVADDNSGRWGVAADLGLQKLVGGDRDYSNLDQNFGFMVVIGISERWTLEGSLKYGYNRPGALEGQDAGLTTGSVHAFYTAIWQYRMGAKYYLVSAGKWRPYGETFLGLADLKVHDQNDTGDFGVFPDGQILRGYGTDGRFKDLEQNLYTFTLGLGLEYFMSENVSLDLGASYAFMFGVDRDNVGTGNLWGPEEIDANTGLAEAHFGVRVYFSKNDDRDGDGVINRLDKCPDTAEDDDGFQDADGCPDLDNDGDGILDADDRCPDVAEDLDGFQDDDGCPEPDNDGDGVLDGVDRCPDEAGPAGGDGCPDVDKDGDGVPDSRDQCLGTAAGVAVGEDGCPEADAIQASMTLAGVTFLLGQAELSPESSTALDAVVASLEAYPEVTLEIQGHTDSSGSSAVNLNLSQRRAESVRDYLISRGIAANRLTAVGYGEDLPVASNETPAGQAANRRVELVRTDH